MQPYDSEEVINKKKLTMQFIPTKRSEESRKLTTFQNKSMLNFSVKPF